MAYLKAERNIFDGMVIDPAALPSDPRLFQDQLQNTIDRYRREAVKVVWLTLPPVLASHVPAAVAAGFAYHHADSEALELTLRLQPDAHIPPYATHYIGAGGAVIDEEENLLVVTEVHHRKAGRLHYKLPGGALEAGEHIADAVVREVEEETAIKTEFESLVCFRHWHGYRYGKSDIYFVCRLKPLTRTITPDPAEIDTCLWMPVRDFLESADTHPFNRKIVQAALNGSGLELSPITDYGSAETHELLFPSDQKVADR